MEYISKLKELGITFNEISECKAEYIMKNEISYYKLMEYSCVFERYNSTEQKGKFINLDFSQLYYLSKIDFELSYIAMQMCLELELIIKTIFLNDVMKFVDTKAFMKAYYKTDEEYISFVYTADNFETIKSKYNVENIFDLDFDQFIDVVQFGTFERILKFFYNEVVQECSSKVKFVIEQIACIRRIRNIVAHNNSILGQLSIKRDCKNFKLLAFLGKNGIKNKMLKTNMSKGVVADLCGLFYLYFNLVNSYEKAFKRLSTFNKEYCKKFLSLYSNNSVINSFYSFMTSVIEIFRKNC